MIKRLIESVGVISMVLFVSFGATKQPEPEPPIEVKTVKVESREYTSSVTPTTKKYVEVKTLVKEKEQTKGKEIGFSKEDIELMALIAMAEAEGESEQGKRLVISTILNRVDSEHFPDSVEEVIYQPNAFTSVWNGRIDRCEVTPDVCQLVEEEIVSRTNGDVVFFSAGDYSKYGEPMFNEGNHYFSSYS